MTDKKMITLSERAGEQEEMYRKMLWNFGADLRVAAPGIIQSFDSSKQTVVVQLAIRERVILDGQVQDIQIPLLVDVPIMIPRAGGFVLTLPIRKGDECLVIFSDRCIDGWYQSGGVQNQMDRRQHDLSDAFALIGVSSQPNVITGYDTDCAALRNTDGSVSVKVKSNEIDVAAPTVNINGSTAVNIAGGSEALIDARFATFFDTHTHSSSGAGVPNTLLTPNLANNSTAKTKAG